MTSPQGMIAKFKQMLALPDVQATVISQAIRNELEAFHGGLGDDEQGNRREGFITDEQMWLLNIVIRRSVYQSLVTIADARKGGEKGLEYCSFELGTFGGYERPGTEALTVACEQAFAGYRGQIRCPAGCECNHGTCGDAASQGLPSFITDADES
jgi:hypothetical protein